MRRAALLLLFVVIVAVAAYAGARYLPGAWYASLTKPPWTPPNWLFGPVWTALYMMIAVAGWLVWQSEDDEPVTNEGLGAAKGFWIAQLVLNAAWSPAMFGAHRIGLALIIIAAMWLTISAFIATTWPRRRLAAWLFVPYLVWVSYAGALNFAIWRLNP